MWQRTIAMSNSKRTLLRLLAFSIVTIIVTTYMYSHSGFHTDTFVNNFRLPKLGSTNFNKAVYNHNTNASLVEDYHSTASLLLINKSLADISQQKTKNVNEQDQISNKTNSNTDISRLNLETFRRTPLHPNFNYRHREQWLFYRSSDGQFNKSAYDIMSMNPITFDNAYKNPCWREGGRNGIFKDGNHHCLPYFYLIGVKKSGTSDFMSRISLHPEYCKAPTKELEWFARRRFGVRVSPEMARRFSRNGYDMRKVEAFSSMFDSATSCIMSHPSTEDTSVKYRRIVDGSPSNFHMHSKWELLPGNENLTEPRYTNFHYIKHLTPDARIIVLFRDPTTRLYSDFWQVTNGYFGRSSPAVFHVNVLKLIRMYKSCFSHSTIRSCVYNHVLPRKLLTAHVPLYGTAKAGFYAVFMEDMLSVFGKDRILPIFMPDYITKMEETLRNVFSFLGMTDVNDDTMFKMLNSKKMNVGRKKAQLPMLNATMELLYDFYRPFNEKMATIMNDSRYLFQRA